MMNFRYATTGQWFKGNTHIHSVASDGGQTFPEIAGRYADAGYDFLFRTDHWVASDTSRDQAVSPLLWLDGIELDGRDEAGAYYHVVCLGRVKDICREDGFEPALRSAQEQGALAILAHPFWCGNSLEDTLRWAFDGVEIYNHDCHWLNGKSGGLVHWDAILMQRSSALAVAVDDAHLKPGHPCWNGGWIVVNAPACTAEGIMDGIRRGNFYSSCGPAIQCIDLVDNQLHVETSPIQSGRLVGPRSKSMRLGSPHGEPIRSLRFSLPREWEYVYLQVEDGAGRRAWTNALFTNEES